MKWYWIKTTCFIKKLFPNYIWSIPSSEKKVYLTFDDGPIPEVTPWVLNVLKDNNIKATFFCIGNNIEKNPDIFQLIVQQDHSIGNHTYDHLNSWKTKNSDYFKNIEECEKIIEKYILPKQSKLFRPPYGKIKLFMSSKICNKGYKIIMWDVLSADFDSTISPEKCYENVVKNVSSGSIIIFHDSIKAYNNLKFALPKVISFLKGKGYAFEKLS